MYKTKQLGRHYIIVKNNIMVSDEEVGQENWFNYEAEASQAIDDIKPTFTTIILAKES